MNANFSFSLSEWQAPISIQHPFVEQIREAVLKYRLQSASHFGISIEVSQAMHEDNPDRFVDLDKSFVLFVGFYSFGIGPVLAACRPKIKKGVKVFREEVEVYTNGGFVSLEWFLSIEFPRRDEPVGDAVMFHWWNNNGQTFNWMRLPTELKEQIVQFCMHRSPPSSPISRRSRGRKVRGAPEVTGQFNKWTSLFSVSHQVRAICLRLCFVGSSDMAYSNGICIVAKDLYSFKSCIRRLGKHRQLIKPNGVPNDDKTWELSDLYKSFPRIYPHLNQYATFCHGIRKMYLGFSFLDSLHFFKVTAGSFSQHWESHRPDHEVLERLPYLNELFIRLPDVKGLLEDNPRQPVRLFYGEPFNCPRVLHRLIFERAAKALAPFDVNMYGFIDDEEEIRFNELLVCAKEGLKITTKELEEIYRDDMGGVELEESVEPGIEKENMVMEEREIIYDDFWPPKCRCEVLCRKVVHPSSM
ncbi:hypothetical protein ACET3X_004984 [Alternaria dauci]|uniref:F-box domain-containing protein n=1 Tax=Alternaria dauci TaxID=48095 RepID=A0ABR3ULG4_9PLEO